MIVFNFKTCEISQGVRKLAQTLMLIKKIFFNIFLNKTIFKNHNSPNTHHDFVIQNACKWLPKLTCLSFKPNKYYGTL